MGETTFTFMYPNTRIREQQTEDSRKPIIEAHNPTAWNWIPAI
jgi:hypothetical protein